MRRAGVLVLVCLALVAASCDFHLIVPTGDAPLRYRDAVFAQVSTDSNIPYGSAVNEQGSTQTLLLDLYRPVGDAITSGRPAIVWVHGGGFRAGDKTSPEIVDEATTFSQKGYVNASISYRLSATGCVPFGAQCLNAIVNAKHDALAAVRFLRANADAYGIDPTRIAIGGTSAGAITALNVAFGADDPGSSGNPGFPSDVKAAVSLSGARVLTTPSAGDGATLLFHGTADPLVGYQSAVSTRDLAVNAGLTSYLTTFEGAGHVPYVQYRQTILDQTSNFLYWMLGLSLAPR